jgi:hypothetical protein
MDALKDHGTLLWLHVSSKDFAPSATAGDAVAVPELRRLAEQASARGLRLAIYPHFKDWTERTADAIRLAKAVDRPNFGVDFNLCHALMTGDEASLPALLDEAKPHLFSVTLNGADAGAGGSSWQRLIQPLGRGSFDVAAFLGQLDRIGFQGPLFQQGYGIGQPPEELLAASMHAWRTRLAAGWEDLPFGATGSAWRDKPGGWLNAGAAGLDPANPGRLALAPGDGIAANGSEGRAPDLLTTASFADCELHVEFMLAQKSNSGIYLMERYEVQIYDSFGVAKDQYPGIECGGIYPQWLANANVGGHSPRVNASLPAGRWQSFDVVFRAPRFDAEGRKISPACFVKVLHNGIMVHENIEVPGPTRAGAAGELAAAPLRLQGDHGPVAYRHLRLKGGKAPRQEGPAK